MIKSPLDDWIGKKLNISMKDRTRLEAYQVERINRVIRLAGEQSPYYRMHLPRIELSSLADRKRLPFTDSGILQKQGARMVCVPSGIIARIVTLTTTGTTGNPKRIFFTKADQELTVDFFEHGMSVLTDSGDKVLIGLPCKSPGCVGDLLRRGLERYGALPLCYGPIDNLAGAAKMLHAERPEVLVGAPSQVLELARFCGGHEIETGIKRILVSTDYAAPEVIREIEKRLGCEVFNHYGMTEMGLGGAVECSAHEGMHIRENDLYMETVDPQTGEILPDGQTGELVFTTLTRTGMPLIRYRTGDLGSILAQPCRCGSILKRVTFLKRK